MQPIFNVSTSAPSHAKRPRTDARHGYTRTDDYAWLRADNWQEVFKDTSVLNGEIRAVLEAENDYEQKLFAGTEDLQETIFQEIKGRIKEDEESVPEPDGPYAYGTSWAEGGQHPRIYRIPRDNYDANKTILLDGDKEAEPYDYFQTGGATRSPDHSKILWGYDNKGSEYFTLKVRDLTTFEDHPDIVVNTKGSGVWDASGTGFFYVMRDAQNRPSRVYYHRLGTIQDDDLLIYEEKDTGFFVGIDGGALHDFIFISIRDHETSEYRVLSANDPVAEPVMVAKRQTGLEYDLEPAGEIFFILTNDGGAKDFRIMQTPTTAPGKDNWTEVVPHEPGRLILGIQAYKNHLVWVERRDCLPRIVIRERTSGEEHAIAFEEDAHALELVGSAEYDTDVIRFFYTSLSVPGQEFDYNMATRERTLLKEFEVPSGHNPEDYITRRILAPAHDGEAVPVSLIMRKETPLDGSAPCLLEGYGSYGLTIPAEFNICCLSLVDRGFIYAIAHVRGGMDKGYAWYENGKKAKKTNTFQDFISVAVHLVNEDYTSHDRLIAEGGSAGGMLIGAVANMAPQKFAGFIAKVPFVDVLNTILDDTLPLTPPEWAEWGNPITSKEDYERIAAYSPYDNVADLPYPPILAIGGLTDPRVTYWEPAKWVAKLRDCAPHGGPYLLKTHMGAGHGGASGRFDQLRDWALAYAFALKVLGRVE